ncbi:hypothetical protein TNIN_459291 [Trichonephila inaurata madagascariensis]|uniref:Uncharacterized protein n=1 Tax=Trichonephila inaurata madagascariensis TaxID=2747483 RepID=A0A8X7CJT0_9ARAC|nr:hypothetical protein TNIN_459291 [Trichonephila inaurata madagascariensis]
MKPLGGCPRDLYGVGKCHPGHVYEGHLQFWGRCGWPSGVTKTPLKASDPVVDVFLVRSSYIVEENKRPG